MMHPIIPIILKATLLLAFALLLCGALVRFNPRWRILVCELVAGAVLLLPLISLFPATIPVSSFRGDGGSNLEFIAIPTGEIVLDEFEVSDSPSWLEGNEVPAAVESAPPETTGSSRPWWASPAILLWSVYSLGVGYFLLRILFRSWRLRQSLDQLAPAGDRPRELLCRIASEFEMGAIPELLVTSDGASPFCAGLRTRQAIVLPEFLTTRDQEASLELVLRHELHHLANGDLGRSAFMTICTMALWWHPLMWWLARTHDSALEELGDRTAAQGEEGRELYRSSLARLALELRSKQLPPMALSLFRTPQIVTRLRRLGFSVAHHELHPLAKLGACFAVASLALTVGVIQAAQAETENKKGEIGEGRSVVAHLPEGDQDAARKAITAGLEALANSQAKDGGFSRKSDDPNRAQSGITALAGITFLAHGAGSPDSNYHENMKRCLRYVLNCQAESGLLMFDKKREKTTSLYDHFIATSFLAGALDHVDGVFKELIAKRLSKAVKVIIDAQGVEKTGVARGGWRYTPKSKGSDLSCSAWAIRALFGAREAGVKIEDKVFQDALKYVLSLQNPDGGFSYLKAKGPSISNIPRTAMALYCLEKGGMGDTEQAKKARDYLLERLETPDRSYPFYGILWGGNAMSLSSHDAAKSYAKWMFEHCRKTQDKKGLWPSLHGDNLGAMFVLLGFGDV